MSGKVEFRKEMAVSRFLVDGDLQEKRVEIRHDPLTGRRTRIMDKASLVEPGADFSEIFRVPDCPFCGDRIEVATPSFPDEIAPEGRLRHGTVTLLPNMYPYADHTAVVVFDEHRKGIDDFGEREIADALAVGLTFIERVHDLEPEVRHCSINWNFLPPSGSSVIHPHMQVMMDRRPTYLQQIILERVSEWPGFWREYLEVERQIGERYVTSSGRVHLITPFAPLGFDEVDALVEEAHTFDDLGERDLEDLASVIQDVLGLYESLGRSSFNMALYSGPLGEGDYGGPGGSDAGTAGDMWVNLKIVGRSNIKPFYRADVGYTERLHLESVVNKTPEELASQMRVYLGIG